ncbi:hypothetical protein EJ08DRAFT_688017 [Tothia fuscella]|uniref:DASH complex subunit ASK1 n=1 Tax=Tothia fuscella TaxID=1048955 RepID=A0A9P4TX96_9PEZI|nr:hypothetical protein EJ08DRAFT_688017 [Tothia fuscella]
MARPSAAATRNLTLTEELEKLEQSITLTLQEIDHNFSRAHRIVTTSILPIVEQYAKHSDNVWEGSKFWKQFFEASANVSLSGYEEAPVEDTTINDEEIVHDDRSPQPYTSPSNIDDETITSPEEPTRRLMSDDDNMLSSPSIGGRHSTPRMPTTATKGQKPINAPPQPTFAEDYPSPYEALKREVDGKSGRAAGNPTTPGKIAALPDMTMTPETSPFTVHTLGLPSASTKNKDTLLHQGILNRNYRVAATPHTGRKQKTVAATPSTANRTRRLLDFDESLSSPLEEAPAPQLRRELFSSPMKGPRTPGVSVQTPGYKKRFGREDNAGGIPNRAVAPADTTRGRTGGGLTGRSLKAWESDDDEDDSFDMSPPKTIMFNLPESRILQTPAQEASRRIVEDILYSAGGDITDDIDDSPSIVQRNRELDETF